MVQAVSCFSCFWLHDQTNHSTVCFHWTHMLFGSTSPVNILMAANNVSQELPCSTSIYCRPTGRWEGFPLPIRHFLVFCVLPSVTCRNWLWTSWRGCFTILSVTTSPWKTLRTSSWLRRATWTVQSPTWTSTVCRKQISFHTTHGHFQRHSDCSNSFFSFFSSSFRSEPNTTGKTHMCAQKPDLCLRHRIYHQRYAHCSESNAPQRNEVGRLFPAVFFFFQKKRKGRTMNKQTLTKILDCLWSRSVFSTPMMTPSQLPSITDKMMSRDGFVLATNHSIPR